MKQPRILISTIDGDSTNYQNAVGKAGGISVPAYCPSEDIPFDGLLLAGGGDIAPVFFGEENKGSYAIDWNRDIAEFSLVQACLAQNKPILGICRGHQVVNVALGGMIEQDISDSLKKIHEHNKDDGSDAQHLVQTKKHSLMREIFGEEAMLNSAHHQAVSQAGHGMDVTAWTTPYVCEATEHRSYPICSVQFHPERLHLMKLSSADRLFSWLISQCK